MPERRPLGGFTRTPAEAVKVRAPARAEPAGGGRRPKKPRGLMGKLFVLMVWLFALGSLSVAVGIAGILVYYSSQLPDFRQLTEYKPPLITKMYDRENRIIAEFAKERRIWVPIDQIPKPLIDSFLAAEDTHFYQHGGYDLKAIVRAAVVNATTHRTQGASTITQQVAKTFLLSGERTYTRKIKELILSWRIENAYSKNQILELYLNRIYLGNGSYGVAAAAQTYFSKTLDELTLPERAMIAGLPQAPTRYNPVRNPKAAQARRDIVLRRLETEGFIDKKEADAAIAMPLTLSLSPLKSGQDAPHFSEYIRRQVEQEYGQDALYNDGLIIYTTLDLDMQRAAEEAVHAGLREYDRRHGWRGPLGHIEKMDNWVDELDVWAAKYEESWRIGRVAVVTKVGTSSLELGLEGGDKGSIPASGYKWTGKGAKTLAKRGDVLLVSRKQGAETYNLEQLPDAQSALVALDVRTGEVRAMVGGLGQGVGFNRAIQAKRQLGSSFKPFVYAAALEKGYTPASIILDAPVVFRDGDKEWKPENYNNEIGGPTPLRRGIEKSRNLMTIRLAQETGLRPVADVVERMGFKERMDITDLTMVLGTYQATPLEATAAYSVFPRGGLYVAPTFVRRIQDAQGATVQRSLPLCDSCLGMLGASKDEIPEAPGVAAKQALGAPLNYQMVSMLEGVVQRGTATALRTLGRPLAGKTGTTNDYVDAWFIGFSPSLAVGVWVGKDSPTSLGYGETGGKAAVPIWKMFMQRALANQPNTTFAVPQGIEFVKIDADSGLLPGSSTQKTMLEAFVPGTAPTTVTPWLGDDGGFGFGGGEATPEGEQPRGGGFNFFGIF